MLLTTHTGVNSSIMASSWAKGVSDRRTMEIGLPKSERTDYFYTAFHFYSLNWCAKTQKSRKRDLELLNYTPLPSFQIDHGRWQACNSFCCSGKKISCKEITMSLQSQPLKTWIYKICNCLWIPNYPFCEFILHHKQERARQIWKEFHMIKRSTSAAEKGYPWI